MQIGVFLIILLAVSSIIPSLIVAVVLFLRQEAMRQDIKTAVHQVALIERDHKTLIDQTADTLTKTAVNAADIAGVKLRMAAIEESFIALSNKWNSRLRIENREKRKEAKDDLPDPVYEEIPGTVQQQLPFPNVPLTFPQKNNKRKFGEMPGRM